MGTDGTLATARSPAPSTITRSVNVPPMSTAIEHGHTGDRGARWSPTAPIVANRPDVLPSVGPGSARSPLGPAGDWAAASGLGYREPVAQEDATGRPPPGSLPQLYLVAGVTMAGVSAVFALFAELEQAYGLSTTSIGWIAGSAFLAGLVAQLWLSRYADRGHAGRLLRAGVVAAAVGLLWFAASTEVWQFVAARSLLGAGVGMIIPPARRAIVLTAGTAPGERLGTFYASYLAGFVFGPRSPGC